MEDLEVVREFLIESNENLVRLDQEMVELERDPANGELLASVFRTIHTIKGTCGFLGFTTLEGITHHAENILSQVRNGERPLTPYLVSLVLETVDAVREQLVHIEETGSENGNTRDDLRSRLEHAHVNKDEECAPAGTPETRSEAAVPPAVTQPHPAVPSVQWPESAPETIKVPSVADLVPAVPAEDADRRAKQREEDAKQEPGGVSKAPAAADSTIRVDVDLLDKLMDLVGELVLVRNQVLQMPSEQNAVLSAASQRLNLVTSQLQEGVMKTRMQPIGVIWGKLPRVVRDLAASCGKQILVEMEGAETELDKSIIEAIKDPLTHMVRNCCDHGIEPPEERVKRGKPAQGRLTLRAFHEGGQVNIEVNDDGGGINPERVKQKAIDRGLLRPEVAERMTNREAFQLIFLPGFSTAEKVSNISGRGVGMDVVKTNIEKIGGTVDLSSVPGKGTSLRLRIPLTLAIIPGLVVRVTSEQFVIPQGSLVELLRIEQADGQPGPEQMIETIHGSRVYRRRGQLLPIVYLEEVLSLERNPQAMRSEAVNILVLQAEEKQFGLVVDQIQDTQEIVVKPLGQQLKGLSCYAGATIMGDGRVALILDVGGVGKRAGVLSEARSHATAKEEAQTSGGHRQVLILFRAGSFERLTLPLGLVSRLEEFPRESLEKAAGRTVVQYRGGILPLLSVEECLERTQSLEGKQSMEAADPVPVIVFGHGGRQIGLVVDQVVDIIDEELSAIKPSSRPGLVGSAVLAGKVIDFVDLPALLEAAGQSEFTGSGPGARPLRVLLADRSVFTREVVKNYLEVEGHRVWEAASAEDALRLLEAMPLDVVLASAQLPDRLRQMMSSRPALARIPVVGFRGDAGEEGNGWFDRAALIDSLLRLRAATEPVPAPGDTYQEVEQ